MNGELKSQRGFTITELLQKENMVLETADDFEEGDGEDDMFLFSANRNITGQEMLKYLNIEDDEDDADDEEVDSVKIVPCGTSFEKLKLTMTDISGDGKVFKSVKRKGVGEIVPRDAMVYIHYMGYFEYQDEPFDSSYLRQSRHRIRLNRGSLIEGLEIGIQTMKKHEIAHFVIHPDYAYGRMGCPPRVPSDEEVMFAVCLIDCIDNAEADTYESLDQAERRLYAKSFPKAMAYHATANDDFNRNRIRQAVKGYERVVTILGDIRLENETEQIQQQKALTRALVNLGVCHNRLKEPRKACIACKSVPLPNAKAHFTYGRALMSMGEYDAAMQELHKAKRLEPCHRRIVAEIRDLNEKMRRYKINEKQLWSRCLSVRKGEEKTSELATIARKFCEDLLRNPDSLRQPLPAGLDDNELDCFREQAAMLGLSFAEHERFGKLDLYICKSEY